jgi:hypothetical protein
VNDADDARQLLDLPLMDNDAGAATIRDYLIALLTTLWREEENFNGKRPFGNSGWQHHDVYAPMVLAGIIPGHADEDGDVDDYDDDAAKEQVIAAIEALGKA